MEDIIVLARVEVKWSESVHTLVFMNFFVKIVMTGLIAINTCVMLGRKYFRAE
jgi:hypothetical protein